MRGAMALWRSVLHRRAWSGQRRARAEEGLGHRGGLVVEAAHHVRSGDSSELASQSVCAPGVPRPSREGAVRNGMQWASRARLTAVYAEAHHPRPTTAPRPPHSTSNGQHPAPNVQRNLCSVPGRRTSAVIVFAACRRGRARVHVISRWGSAVISCPNTRVLYPDARLARQSNYAQKSQERRTQDAPISTFGIRYSQRRDLPGK